jgi:hypothetical protein
MTQEALKRVAEKLRRTGASIPAPEVTGTIEGSVVTGLCIALALVEAEIEALAQPEQVPVMWPCLIDSADFSANSITLVMQCEDYKVSAGTHWLSTTPPKETT